jgi:hypothetical protein
MVGLVAAAMASAAPTDPCGGFLGTNVVSGTFTGCTLGSVTFTNFQASAVWADQTGGLWTPVITLVNQVLTYQTGFSGGTATLAFLTNFDVIGMTRPKDILFSYTATGNIIGIDGWSGGSAGTNISEKAYGGANGTTLLATLNIGAGQYLETKFGTQTSVTVSKDISIPIGASLSEFTQSIETPEPMTFVLIGSGLLALGLVRRRSRG